MIRIVFRNRFHGYYYKHQKGKKIVCFIPGISKSGAFIQVITDNKSYNYNFNNASFKEKIDIGNCCFSKQGINIDLPGIKGNIEYENLTPLKSDIMGIFKFFPMECRHGVVSMRHNLKGYLIIEEETYDFNDGLGYIEFDKGKSFPKRYVWIQSNEREDLSIMLSVAHIPFYGINFEGCICAIIYKGKEYRLATYNGARADVLIDKVIITQGKLRLESYILNPGRHFILSYPIKGKMSGLISEHNNSRVRFKLYHDKELLFDKICENCGYEKHNY